VTEVSNYIQSLTNLSFTDQMGIRAEPDGFTPVQLLATVDQTLSSHRQLLTKYYRSNVKQSDVDMDGVHQHYTCVLCSEDIIGHKFYPKKEQQVLLTVVKNWHTFIV
jgi:hypothetical protein